MLSLYHPTIHQPPTTIQHPISINIPSIHMFGFDIFNLGSIFSCLTFLGSTFLRSIIKESAIHNPSFSIPPSSSFHHHPTIHHHSTIHPIHQKKSTIHNSHPQSMSTIHIQIQNQYPKSTIQNPESKIHNPHLQIKNEVSSKEVSLPSKK